MFRCHKIFQFYRHRLHSTILSNHALNTCCGNWFRSVFFFCTIFTAGIYVYKTGTCGVTICWPKKHLEGTTLPSLQLEIQPTKHKQQKFTGQTTVNCHSWMLSIKYLCDKFEAFHVHYLPKIWIFIAENLGCSMLQGLSSKGFTNPAHTIFRAVPHMNCLC